MSARPMLARKVLDSTVAQWVGRHPREIPDGDMWRWQACVLAARRIVGVG